MGRKLFEDALSFARHLASLHERRKKVTRSQSRGRRLRLSATARSQILESTDSRCHICGGEIGPGERWTADHVLPHARGGGTGVENHLPSHGLCNNYRWHYSPEELQWILKLGVWTRTQIEKRDPLAMQLAERFVSHERKRNSRRVPRTYPRR